MRRSFTRSDALAIGRKLGGKLVDDRNNHDRMEISNDGKLVARFGVRRSSKEVGHGHLPRGLRLTQQDARRLLQCTLSKGDYFALLKEQDNLHRQAGI